MKIINYTLKGLAFITALPLIMLILPSLILYNLSDKFEK
jgi:hypothetical protein